MNDFNDTLMFVKVVEKGSFTAAAQLLGVPKGTLSRKITELEQRLGTRLLKRTTRKLGLTEAGALYYERSARIAVDLAEAEAAVSQLSSAPRGWLRFTAPYALGTDAIAPLLPEFMARYPDVRVETVLTNDHLDIIGTDLDVALRIGKLPDSSLTARRLATIQTHVYASADYLARHGEPLEPGDLERHRTLASTRQRQHGRYFWPLSDGQRTLQTPVDPVFVANDPPSLLNAVVSGVGIALLGDAFTKVAVAQGRLRRVLGTWAGPTAELNAVFPPGRVNTPKVKAFVDFLSENLRIDAVAKCRHCGESVCQCCGGSAVKNAGERAGFGATIEAVGPRVAENELADLAA